MIELLLLLLVVGLIMACVASIARATAQPIFIPVRVRDEHIRRRR